MGGLLSQIAAAGGFMTGTYLIAKAIVAPLDRGKKPSRPAHPKADATTPKGEQAKQG